MMQDIRSALLVLAVLLAEAVSSQRSAPQGWHLRGVTMTSEVTVTNKLSSDETRRIIDALLTEDESIRRPGINDYLPGAWTLVHLVAEAVACADAGDERWDRVSSALTEMVRNDFDPPRRRVKLMKLLEYYREERRRAPESEAAVDEFARDLLKLAPEFSVYTRRSLVTFLEGAKAISSTAAKMARGVGAFGDCVDPNDRLACRKLEQKYDTNLRDDRKLRQEDEVRER